MPPRIPCALCTAVHSLIYIHLVRVPLARGPTFATVATASLQPRAHLTDRRGPAFRPAQMERATGRPVGMQHDYIRFGG